MRRTRIGATALFVIGFAAAASAQQPPAEKWQPLFNGRDLAGWHALPGGKWLVLDGQIIGVGTKREKRHGLLVSDKTYSDFRLRVEFMSIVGNSGLYFRVQKVDHAVGVKGFQAEICPKGGSIAGLYETLGRKWVAHSDAKKVMEVMKPGNWNTMEVHAVGGNITVLLNGVKVTELTDDPGLKEGHIALQMHGGADMDVRFRTIEIQTLDQHAE